MRRPDFHPKLSKDYNFLAIVITMCLLSSCAVRSNSATIQKKADPNSIALALSAAEKLFDERSDVDNLRKAVNTLGLARDPDQRNFEVEWKFAKYSFFLGKAEQNEDEAEAAFERGKDAGMIASRVEPDKPDGHFWYAANLGELSRISPITVGIKSVDDLRERLNRVIELNPDYQNASAYDALGELEMETRTIKGGKAEKAVEYFEKGIRLSPDNSNLHLHLAEAYLAVKKDTKAREELNTVLTMKPNPNYVLEHLKVVEDAKRVLEKNF